MFIYEKTVDGAQRKVIHFVHYDDVVKDSLSFDGFVIDQHPLEDKKVAAEVSELIGNKKAVFDFEVKLFGYKKKSKSCKVRQAFCSKYDENDVGFFGFADVRINEPALRFDDDAEFDEESSQDKLPVAPNVEIDFVQYDGVVEEVEEEGLYFYGERSKILFGYLENDRLRFFKLRVPTLANTIDGSYPNRRHMNFDQERKYKKINPRYYLLLSQEMIVEDGAEGYLNDFLTFFQSGPEALTVSAKPSLPVEYSLTGDNSFKESSEIIWSDVIVNKWQQFVGDVLLRAAEQKVNAKGKLSGKKRKIEEAVDETPKRKRFDIGKPLEKVQEVSQLLNEINMVAQPEGSSVRESLFSGAEGYNENQNNERTLVEKVGLLESDIALAKAMKEKKDNAFYLAQYNYYKGKVAFDKGAEADLDRAEKSLRAFRVKMEKKDQDRRRKVEESWTPMRWKEPSDAIETVVSLENKVSKLNEYDKNLWDAVYKAELATEDFKCKLYDLKINPLKDQWTPEARNTLRKLYGKRQEAASKAQQIKDKLAAQ